jgi:hypothetical protein
MLKKLGEKYQQANNPFVLSSVEGRASVKDLFQGN